MNQDKKVRRDSFDDLNDLLDGSKPYKKDENLDLDDLENMMVGKKNSKSS